MKKLLKKYDGLLLSGGVGILVVIQIDDVHAGGDGFDRPVSIKNLKMQNMHESSLENGFAIKTNDRVRRIKY